MDLANEGAEFVDLERAGRKILRDVVLQQLLHGEQPLGICSFCFESCSMRSGCLWSRIAPTFAAIVMQKCNTNGLVIYGDGSMRRGGCNQTMSEVRPGTEHRGVLRKPCDL
jgi:hypothetical protein